MKLLTTSFSGRQNDSSERRHATATDGNEELFTYPGPNPFVLLNRDRSHTHPAHTYDIVIGPIADDGVTYQLRRYSMGDISMSRLIEELKYANGLTIQYYFGTEHALSYLKKL